MAIRPMTLTSRLSARSQWLVAGLRAAVHSWRQVAGQATPLPRLADICPWGVAREWTTPWAYNHPSPLHRRHRQLSPGEPSSRFLTRPRPRASRLAFTLESARLVHPRAGILAAGRSRPRGRWLLDH